MKSIPHTRHHNMAHDPSGPMSREWTPVVLSSQEAGCALSLYSHPLKIARSFPRLSQMPRRMQKASLRWVSLILTPVLHPPLPPPCILHGSKNMCAYADMEII